MRGGASSCATLEVPTESSVTAAILARRCNRLPDGGRGFSFGVSHPLRLCRERCRLDNMRQIKVTRRAPVWLDAQAPLAEWYATPLGQSILEDLDSVLATRLGDVFLSLIHI